jgi:hypothetical protein
MRDDMIRVEPARSQRVAFARWAVQQTPKIRTVSATEFACPRDLFIWVPDELLVGAIVDGHRYISPEEVEDPTPDGEESAAAPLDPAPEPDEPGTAANAAQTAVQGAEDGPPYACGICDRELATVRGRDAHRRQAHPGA